MKIEQLELRAYGPFTNEVLDFSAGQPGLHLVYGPNEAGKSTTLRSIHALLYGMTGDLVADFVHPAGDLRIGARLTHLQDGQPVELHCVRRKGKAGSLRDGDDATAIEPLPLERMLGGIDAASFAQRFGIDYPTLVEGGKQVTAGKGELGQLLFSAGSGLANLGKLLTTLDTDAAAVFKPSGSTGPSLNVALGKYKTATKRLKDSQLSLTEWQKKHDDLAADQKTRQTLQLQLADLAARRKRLDTYRLSKTDMARRQEILVEQRDLMNVPLLAEGFSQRRSEVAAARDKLASFRQLAQANVADLEKQLAQIVVPTELLSRASQIEALLGKAGAHHKAQKDRIGLAQKSQQLIEQATKMLASLGLAADSTTSLSKLSRVEVGELLSQHQSLTANLTAKQGALNSCSVTVARLQAQLKENPGETSFTALEAVVKSTLALRDLPQQISRLKGDLANTQFQIEAGLAKLAPWQGAADDLPKLAVPAAETLDQHEQQLREVEDDLKKGQTKATEAAAELAEVEIDIQRLKAGGKVYSESELKLVRQQRDELWTTWRKLSKATSAAESESLLEQYLTAVAQADEIADLLYKNAEQSAELASLEARQAKLNRQLEAANVLLAKLADKKQSRQQAWQAIWQPLQITPLSPREMRGWTVRVSELAKLVAQRQEKEVDLVAKQELILAADTQLRSTLSEPNVAAETSPTAFLARLSAAEGELEKLRQRQQTWQTQGVQLRDYQQQQTQAEQEVKKLESQQQTWQQKWEQALASIHLPPQTSPAQAKLVLDSVDEVASLQTQGNDASKRVQDIDQDAADFQQEAQAVLTAIAADLLSLGLEVALPTLRDRLQQAQQRKTTAAQLQQQLTAEQARLRQTTAELAGIDQQLVTLCQEAGCTEPTDLPRIERQSQSRQALDREDREIKQRLAQLCDGLSLEDFLTAATEHHSVELLGEIRALDLEIQQLEETRSNLLTGIGKKETEFQQMSGGPAAAEAETEAQQLLATIRIQTEEYARLRIAGHLLRKAMDRYREKNEVPVLKRASHLFAALTLGSFEALRASYDEKGGAVLEGVRPGGKEVRVDGMSEGTCDQLYLSLRLASLEVHLQSHAPIPFIVDDILVNFDDERSLAALRVLAEVSQQTQVIFFTHHQHLLELAEQNLDRGLLFTHRLSSRLAQPIAG